MSGAPHTLDGTRPEAQTTQEKGLRVNQPANSAETPWPVGKVNDQVKGWIERLGFLWVEGQITQLNMKPTWKLSLSLIHI